MGRSILDGPIGFEVFPDRRNSRISLKKLLVVYDGTCQGCGYKFKDRSEAEKGHLRRPKSKAGSESKRNLAPLCHPCNKFQGNMTLDQARNLIGQARLLLLRMRQNRWPEFGGRK
jgi:5-methylcytosine-specific restriction endonuclease McrA